MEDREVDIHKECRKKEIALRKAVASFLIARLSYPLSVKPV